MELTFSLQPVVIIDEYPACPYCQEKLLYAFHTNRQIKTYKGKTTTYRIPVCRCGNKDCTFSYTRVLTDDMVPYKHYNNEVIENVVDGICTPNDKLTEDSPCEKTMDRWKDWIAGNRNHINGVLKSVGSRLSDFGEELLKSEDSLMDKLREDGGGWLSVLTRMTWNFGMPFLNARQLSMLSTDLSGVSSGFGLLYSCKEENRDENAGRNKLAGRDGSETLPDNITASGSGPRQSEEDRSP